MDIFLLTWFNIQYWLCCAVLCLYVLDMASSASFGDASSVGGNSVSSSVCLFCDKKCSGRQQSLKCTSCQRTQHRTCGNTGVTQDQYRAAVRVGQVVQWQCVDCMSSHVTNQLATVSISAGTKNPAQLPPTNTNRYAGLDLRRQEFPVARKEKRAPNLIIVSEDVEPEPDYQVIEEGTKRGRPLLVDAKGYTYTQYRTSKSTLSWRCTIRNDKMYCPATVIQRGEDVYERGASLHCHGVDPSAASSARIKREVKQEAMKDIFKSATTIAERAIVNERNANGTRPDIPKVQTLSRIANKHRQAERPDEPVNLVTFEYTEDYLPEFLCGDIVPDPEYPGVRHLMFASQNQQRLLARAKTWYVDGTFKIIKEPFVQLWSIHAFIEKDDNSKQVPLVYIFMSRRKTEDYVAIFRHLNQILLNVEVECMVMDFEAALWKAIRLEYPHIERRGCCFHWARAVWKKIKEYGLQSAYHKDVAVHMLCKHLLGLPFVPSRHIEPCFTRLREEATTPNMKKLFKYVYKNWIRSSKWSPKEWSVYGQSIRTNNDVEGWHHRINAKAGTNSLPFYKTLTLLEMESQFVDVQLQLIHENKLKRLQRTKYREYQGRIFDAWKAYYAGTMNVHQLLDLCGQLYKPPPEQD